jgi:hypothetical protein
MSRINALALIRDLKASAAREEIEIEVKRITIK